MKLIQKDWRRHNDEFVDISALLSARSTLSTITKAPHQIEQT